MTPQKMKKSYQSVLSAQLHHCFSESEGVNPLCFLSFHPIPQINRKMSLAVVTG